MTQLKTVHHKIKRKLGAQVEFQIEAMAKALPKMAMIDRQGQYVYRMQMVDGLDMIEHNVPDKEGNRGVPGVKYRAPVLQYVNHKVEMIAIYKKDGMEGVEQYAFEVNDHDRRNKEYIRKHQPWYIKLKNFLASCFGK